MVEQRAELPTGASIRYAVRGRGTPILCLMGLGSSMDLWGEDFLRVLATDHTVVTLDNRGSGGSSGPFPWTMMTFAADAVGLLRHLGMDKAHVLGISMGGMIAQQIAVSFPNWVDRLALGATACAGRLIRTHLGVLRLVSFSVTPKVALRAIVSDEFMRTNAARIPSLVRQLKAASAGRFATACQLNACIRFDLEQQIEGITAPTLVMGGTGDQVINIANSQLIARKIKGSRLVTYPGVGHAYPLEREAETTTLLREFFRDGTSAGSP